MVSQLPTMPNPKNKASAFSKNFTFQTKRLLGTASLEKIGRIWALSWQKKKQQELSQAKSKSPTLKKLIMWWQFPIRLDPELSPFGRLSKVILKAKMDTL